MRQLGLSQLIGALIEEILYCVGPPKRFEQIAKPGDSESEESSSGGKETARRNLPLWEQHGIQKRVTHMVVGWRSLTNHMTLSQCPLSPNRTLYDAVVRHDWFIK